MRRAARIDDNHNEIVGALRDIGATVKSTAILKGFVDIVVGYRGKNYLMEIKDGSKVPSRRKLTPDEQVFHDEWKGEALIVESVEDAIRALGAKR
jgi:hypothetical protein